RRRMKAGAACRRRYEPLLRTYRWHDWSSRIRWTRIVRTRIVRTHAVFERRPVATAAEGRLNDHLRHRISRVFGHRTRAGLARPAAIVGRRRRRQRPIRRRIDFQAPIAGLLAVPGEVTGHV